MKLFLQIEIHYEGIIPLDKVRNITLDLARRNI